MSGRILGAAANPSGTMTTIQLEAYGDQRSALDGLSGKPVDIEFKPHREKRSQRANRLCWELCSQIGRSMTPPLDKEAVYREAIRAVGAYDQYYIREEALERFMDTRKLLGVGWFAEVVGDAPLRGFVEVFAYKGSSTYDSRQMCTLIDYLVDQAEQMELQIGYELREIDRIKEDYANAVKR